MRKSPINNHHVNSWEEEDVKRGRELYKEGKKGHADALFTDAHDSYNWHGGNYGHEGMSMRGQVSKGPIAFGRAGHVGSYTGNNMKLNPLAETASQERTDLLGDMPIDERATPVANVNKGYGQQVGKPSIASKYDRVVLGGNIGDKSKTEPGKKDYTKKNR